MICFAGFSYFFAYMKSFAGPPSNNLDGKIQITINKNFNLKYFIYIFQLTDIVSNTDSVLSCWECRTNGNGKF